MSKPKRTRTILKEELKAVGITLSKEEASALLRRFNGDVSLAKRQCVASNNSNTASSSSSSSSSSGEHKDNNSAKTHVGKCGKCDSIHHNSDHCPHYSEPVNTPAYLALKAAESKKANADFFRKKKEQDTRFYNSFYGGGGPEQPGNMYPGPKLIHGRGHAKDGAALIGISILGTMEHDSGPVLVLDLYHDGGKDNFPDGEHAIDVLWIENQIHASWEGKGNVSFEKSKHSEHLNGTIVAIERRFFNNQGWPTAAKTKEEVDGGCSGEGAIVFLDNGTFIFGRNKNCTSPGVIGSTSNYGENINSQEMTRFDPEAYSKDWFGDNEEDQEDQEDQDDDEEELPATGAKPKP